MTSTDREALRQQLVLHEGTRLFPYVDSVGKTSIGTGRNLTDRGITDAEARYLLDNDINVALGSLQMFPWFPTLDTVRQRALIDLCFNLGITRLLGFQKCLAACAEKNWPMAAHHLLDSKYATQVGQRAVTLARMLETGQA